VNHATFKKPNQKAVFKILQISVKNQEVDGYHEFQFKRFQRLAPLERSLKQ